MGASNKKKKHLNHNDMANWEKLNKELDYTLNSMTFEDWELLASKRINQTTRTMKEEIVKKLAKEESEYLADWEDKEMYQKGFIDGYNKAKEKELELTKQQEQ
jgi:hypothetical protein